MCDHCGCRSFAPIAELTADHEHILDLAWRVVEGEWPDEAARQDAREQLNRFLDLHAVKEEVGLYPLLIRTGDLAPERCDGLEAEHREVHERLEQAASDPGAFDRRAYFALAAHIEEEEMELFSGARFAFEDEEWVEMVQAHHAAAHQFGIPHDHDHDHDHHHDHHQAVGTAG